MSNSTTKAEQEIAPGEPAVIRRLPEGVEYTLIKCIFIDLPSALTTLLWTTPSEHDPLVAKFKGRTVRAIDRALRREDPINREHVALVRHELVQLCFQELNVSSPHPERSISVDTVFPELFDDVHRPPGPSVQHVRITVRSAAPPRRGSKRAVMPPTVLEERFIASEPAHWDPAIPWIDTDEVDRTVLDLLRKHFPRLMNARVGARWRSDYPPEGWRVITQHVVPRLYDYLRPFYAVRRHRRSGRNGPALYSAQLRRDITDIVRFELPHLADKLTLARVTAAIQRHIARQHSTRKRTKRNRPKQ